VPATPEGNGEAVEMTNGAGLMVSENDWLAADPPASVTRALNDEVP
jgi:hypothetical protein